MRISRILVEHPLEPQALLTLSGEASHYVRQVLRLRKGMRLVVFDGKGAESDAIIEAFGRDETLIRLETPRQISLESPLSIHLALGISRAERMDFAIQKAVELGVQSLTPLVTAFGVVRLDEEKKKTRHLHWSRIIQSACEQSGRNHLPHLNPAITLMEWLEAAPAVGARLLFDPEGTEPLGTLTPPLGGLTLLIGPEGGFSEAEKAEALAKGFRNTGLGPRILRTETAVIAAMAAAQTLWGDLGSNP